MTRLNLSLNFGPRTHEGAVGPNISTELELRRSVVACLLWESQFYEDGVEIAGRIAELVPKVAAEKVAALAIEAREKMKLRHAPLLLVREMARHATHRGLVAETLERVIQRADELAEFVAIYWKDGRVSLSAQVKKGLAAAFAPAPRVVRCDTSGPAGSSPREALTTLRGAAGAAWRRCRHLSRPIEGRGLPAGNAR